MRANMNTFDLKAHELTVSEVHHNLPPSSLYEHAIRFEKDASIAENGALVAYSGAKTGRSPKDKRVVKNPAYYLWEQAERPEGRNIEIWLEAEARGRCTLDHEGCQG
jgi:ATP-dependent phosphoenolpyruvate carboxykinase